MTDERMGSALWVALERLPRGAGIVFRHYAAPDRREIFERVRRLARRRGLVLVLADTPRRAVAWRADGAHGLSGHRRMARPLLRTAPAHDQREMRRAQRSGAEVLFLSPVFATRSHPGARTLGPLRFGLLARKAGCMIIALGGMNRRRARQLRALGADGWAAIDAWTREDGVFNSAAG